MKLFLSDGKKISSKIPLTFGRAKYFLKIISMTEYFPLVSPAVFRCENVASTFRGIYTPLLRGHGRWPDNVHRVEIRRVAGCPDPSKSTSSTLSSAEFRQKWHAL